MQQYQKFFKPCAIFLCVLYLVFILACPFMVLSAYGVSEGASFSDVMEVTSWPILAIIAAVAMAAAVWFLPGKSGAVACAVCGFLALVSFWLAKGADEFKLIGDYLKMGAGPILGLICGLIAAVLCWLSDQGPRPDHTPGVGRGNGNEW